MSIRLMSIVYNAKIPNIEIEHETRSDKIETDEKAKRTVQGSTLKSIALALADHASDDGHGIYPSIDLLCRKTLYSRATIIDGLNALKTAGIIEKVGCTSSGVTKYHMIPNALIEMKFPEEEKSQSHGNTPTSITVIPLNADQSHGNTSTGITIIPSKDDQSHGNTSTGIAVIPKPSINHQLINHQFNPSTQETRTHQEETCGEAKNASPAGPGVIPSIEKKSKTDAVIRGDPLDGILHYAQAAPKNDLESFPEDIRPILKEVLELWNLKPPARTRGGEYALWIKESRLLQDACGEFGLEALHLAHKDWERSKFTVSHPGALVKITRSSAAILRTRRQVHPQSKNDPASLAEMISRVYGGKDIKDIPHL